MYDLSRRTDDVLGSVLAMMAEHTMSVKDSAEITQNFHYHIWFILPAHTVGALWTVLIVMTAPSTQETVIQTYFSH